MADRKPQKTPSSKTLAVKTLVLDISCLRSDDGAVMAELKRAPSLADRLNAIRRAKIRAIVFSDKAMRETQKVLRDSGLDGFFAEKDIVTLEKLVDDGNFSTTCRNIAQAAYFPIKTAMYFGADGQNVKSAVSAGLMGNRVECKEIKAALGCLAPYSSGAMAAKERGKQDGKGRARHY
ncbi:MAG: hypothetical protein FWF01_00885 [Alphaproteobacteria bacterium]|nr:hypothetical protein [Alphaproteobacteria bacterium]